MHFLNFKSVFNSSFWFEKNCKNVVLANSKEHFNVIAKLAKIVWHEHYIPIIGKTQVEYMVAKFQTHFE